MPVVTIVTLSAKDYREAVESCAGQGRTGGSIHDALHLRCAAKAHCDRVFTFNVRHFASLAPAWADRICAP